MSATAAITAIVANTDSGVAATATFTVDGNEVTHTVTLTNCPEGTHGYHIHDGTGCGNDGTDAGGHWNPGNVDHGVWGTDPYHLGDIGNVVCDANGNGTSTMTTTLWTVGDSVAATDVVGHAIILHAAPDDFGQPTGNAGARIACGVITLD